MVTALILINTRRGQINEVAEALVAVEGISEVHSVAGRFDLVAIARVRQNEDLARIVSDHVRAHDGIERSETLIGFRVFSQHDLDRLFAVGME
jgi:DNA-binding Lrp family transcriptional regulator